MNAKDLRKSVQKIYSGMDYYKFCEYMGLNPKYDQRYWEEFQKLSNALSAFDNDSLQKILDFAE